MTKSCSRRHLSLIQALVRPDSYSESARLPINPSRPSLQAFSSTSCASPSRCSLKRTAELDFSAAASAGLRSAGRSLPLGERQPRLVDALEIRRVEDVIDDARVGAGVESVLQGLEARAPIG